MSAHILNSIYKTGHVFGLTAVFFMFLWMRQDDKGFKAADHLEFNSHPLCMALSMMFLNGEALMAFRSLRAYPRHLVKLLHAVLHGTSVLIMAIGIKAVRDSEDFHIGEDGKLSPLPRSQALHAWMGSILGIFYCIQWIASLIVFYFPLTPGHIRATVLPYHRIGGICSFVFAAATICFGVLDRKSWGLNCNSSSICLENWFINLFALAVVGYTACVTAIILNPSWSTKIPLSKITEKKKAH